MTFVDPDDYVAPNSYGKLLAKIQSESLDVLRFNYNQRDEFTGEIIPKYKESLFSVSYDNNIVDGEEFLGRYLGYACYVWQFIFKSTLFTDNNIRFREKVFDDADVLPRILVHVKKISSVDQIVYNYLIRQGSLANAISYEGIIKKISGFFYIIEQYNLFCANYSNKYSYKWFQSSVWNSYVGILQLATIHDSLNIDNYIQKFKSINSLLPSTYNRYFKKKIHITLVSISPKLYCFIYKVLYKKNNK